MTLTSQQGTRDPRRFTGFQYSAPTTPRRCGRRCDATPSHTLQVVTRQGKLSTADLGMRSPEPFSLFCMQEGGAACRKGGFRSEASGRAKRVPVRPRQTGTLAKAPIRKTGLTKLSVSETPPHSHRPDRKKKGRASPALARLPPRQHSAEGVCRQLTTSA
ncbi:hypothetical protein MRX96_002841 [Rhipicephalus microplus]